MAITVGKELHKCLAISYIVQLFIQEASIYGRQKLKVQKRERGIYLKEVKRFSPALPPDLVPPLRSYCMIHLYWGEIK